MSGKQVLKNVSYSFMANAVSLLVSVCMVMFVPKFLPVEEYGLWQLFLFYFSYLGFLHFGWEDGIYLRYAGKEFHELDRRVFAGQFYAVVLLQLVLAALAFLGGWLLVADRSLQAAFLCAACLAPLVNFNNLCNFVMQITNRIKDYARLLLVERLVLLTLVLMLLAVGLGVFHWLFLAKLCSLAATAACGVWLCRSLLRLSFPSFAAILAEAGENIRVGIKLMFANIASMLLVGIVRYGISLGWDIATFGRVSLTLGISNFLMVFISSVSVVFFPIVKRLGNERRGELYGRIRFALTFILLGLLLFYYPLKCVLTWWLPQYAESLVYMSVLFPVCLFESKVDLLTNTYLKSLREEALLLKLNLITVALSAVVTFITVYLLHSLEAAVLSIPVLYACRCAMAELAVGRLLELRLHGCIAEDVLMAVIFVASAWFLDSWFATGLYGLAYTVYIFLHRQQARQIMCELR
ncbi:MAG: hypothetical protein IJU37_06250 [Desulfovibrio sp.]|nr:hypothetical protein [Desulfovibrio sp.]